MSRRYIRNYTATDPCVLGTCEAIPSRLRRLVKCHICEASYCNSSITLQKHVLFHTCEDVQGCSSRFKDAVPGLLVDYTQGQQIVSFDIRLASVRMRAYFWDTATNVQAAPPLCLQTNYSQEADTFVFSFVNSPQHCRSICTDDDRMSIWVDSFENWESVVIANARGSVAS